MGFSRQEYWSGLPFPTPGYLPDLGIEPTSLVAPALAGILYHEHHLGSLSNYVWIKTSRDFSLTATDTGQEAIQISSLFALSWPGQEYISLSLLWNYKHHGGQSSASGAWSSFSLAVSQTLLLRPGSKEAISGPGSWPAAQLWRTPQDWLARSRDLRGPHKQLWLPL